MTIGKLEPARDAVHHPVGAGSMARLRSDPSAPSLRTRATFCAGETPRRESAVGEKSTQPNQGGDQAREGAGACQLVGIASVTCERGQNRLGHQVSRGDPEFIIGGLRGRLESW